MSKGFWVTVRKRVEFCDTEECPYASDKHHTLRRTIYCGVLKRRIRWSVVIDFPKPCPRGKKR